MTKTELEATIEKMTLELRVRDRQIDQLVETIETIGQKLDVNLNRVITDEIRDWALKNFAQLPSHRTIESLTGRILTRLVEHGVRLHDRSGTQTNLPSPNRHPAQEAGKPTAESVGAAENEIE